MNLQDFGTYLESFPSSVFIRQSTWAFATIESIHVIALLTVVGTISIVDLRLIGIASRNCAVTEISRDTLRWTWGAFALAALTGSLMLMAKATSYFTVPALWLKFGFMAAAGVNMLLFQRLSFRSVARWDINCKLPLGARVAGTLSLLCWAMVVIFGRWIGYTVNFGSVFGGGF